MSANTPLYDLASLQELSNGDDTFYEEMVRLFLETTSQSLSELQQAAANSEWKRAGAIAHKMRGPCNHIGAVSFSVLLSRLENEAEKNTPAPSALIALIGQTSGEGERLLSAISADTGIHL